jgi:DNA topoisomerase-2
MTRSIEETYKKLTPLEHILQRPGMYVGDTKLHTEKLWVFDDKTEKIKSKIVTYTPAFIKCFDEILTNATDHSTRDSSLNSIKINIDEKEGSITVWNNGSGIPIEMHKEHKMYVPELIFGHLLSGSNYNDNDNRTGAGLNGLGSKVANIYSKKFIVDTCDGKNTYNQIFENNMSIKSTPIIIKTIKTIEQKKLSYTQIKWIPDYRLFNMTGLDKQSLSLIKKRVYDCIACTDKHVKIYLNDILLNGKGLQEYVKYFQLDNNTVYYENNTQIVNKTEYAWEYVIVPNDTFEQISFINSNNTFNGGTHVNYIVNQIVNKLKIQLETKKKLTELKPSIIKDKFFIFLRATINNPSFNSQTKEQLTTQIKEFGCKVEVSDTFIQKLYKSSIVEDIVQIYKINEELKLVKEKDGKKVPFVKIAKLTDALWAGTNKSNQCTLILTEGLSASNFALWGRNEDPKGTEKYGIMPLKGKCLNVRDASLSQMMNNEEINSIKQILGLQSNVEYKNTDMLRYGRVLLLVDADVDGTHICSLLINMFHYWYPSLLKLNPSFLVKLRTPIIKAIQPGSNKTILEFFNQQDYDKWSIENPELVKKYHIKYFKGLGTSTSIEAKDNFKRIDELQLKYRYENTECDKAIVLAFEKDSTKNKHSFVELDNEENVSEIIPLELKCSDKRKEWLSHYKRDVYVDNSQSEVSFSDFINKELIHFSIYDNSRSIPHICDGLKPSQRKILYYMLKKNITTEIKVAQLTGYISAEMGYHHGEVSLQSTIVNMAQNYISSNNINLLNPCGNFGSRYNNNSAASPRYIFTHLSEITNCIFDKRDLPVLNYLSDDGHSIEPDFLIPIIPMILVNGCQGIGTGYSTFIPKYNPKDIVKNIIDVLNNKELEFISPWYKNYSGRIVKEDDGSYYSYGNITRIDDYTIRITELPHDTYINDYFEYLQNLIPETVSKNKSVPIKRAKKTLPISAVSNMTKSEDKIVFIIKFSDKVYLDSNFDGLHKELKLTKKIHTTNMYLFNTEMILTKYETVYHILKEFTKIRLYYYKLRKENLIRNLEKEILLLDNKCRFINDYINNVININNKPKTVIISILETRYILIDESFDYLLNMKIYNLTKEKIDDLNNLKLSKELELKNILSKTCKDLWIDDLLNLQKLLS